MLLLHWSMLNYAAVVKILKKHGGLPLQIHLERCAGLQLCTSASTCPVQIEHMSVCCHETVT